MTIPHELKGQLHVINGEIVDCNERQLALSQYLECEYDEIGTGIGNDSFLFHGSQEYLVLTDSEADEAAAQNIRDSLWAFRAEFIVPFTAAYPKLDMEGVKALEDLIRSAQNEKCESCNEMIYAIIDDYDAFVSDAISADGRGHFVNTYDGDEHEAGDYFIYRIN